MGEATASSALIQPEPQSPAAREKTASPSVGSRADAFCSRQSLAKALTFAPETDILNRRGG